MKSLAPKYFEALSPLDEPAAYICVIRDIDRDRYRIEATRWPRALVGDNGSAALLARLFPIFNTASVLCGAIVRPRKRAGRRKSVNG